MLSADMSSRERVLAALYNKDVDFTPATTSVCIANYECLKLSNAFFPNFRYNAQSMADLAAASHLLLGFDSGKAAQKNL